MYKLILADETELTVGLCGSYDDGPLYIDVYDSSFVACAQIFTDAAKTAVMIYDITLERVRYEGYTQLASLKLEAGMIKVTMRKPGAQ